MRCARGRRDCGRLFPSIERRHDLVERVERDVRVAVPDATVFTHLEPINGPAAWQDVTLDRRVWLSQLILFSAADGTM
jgi:hypothetical protein